MKPPFSIIALALCVGCAHTQGPFVQGGIRIVPPVTEEGYDKATRISTLNWFNDGGTSWIKITDAEGKKFDVYIDHRIDGPTPGAIYLVNYPGKSNSVLVVNQRDFRRKIGEFE